MEKTIGSQMTSDGFFFDVELLARAGAANLRIEEIPVMVTYIDPTTVKMVTHGWAMIKETIRLRSRLERKNARQTQSAFAGSGHRIDNPMTNENDLVIVVTADDFGIGVPTSHGIIHAHLFGPVTATSLMVVTEDHVKASVPLLVIAPNLDVGLHLVFTKCGHRPLKAGKSSGLTDREGNFLTNGKLWMRAFGGKLNHAAIVEEISAQAELFKQLVGRSATHVDSHHHAHQLPVIRDALVEVIGKGILPRITRTTVEPAEIQKNVSGVKLKRAAANFIGHRAANLFDGNRISHNDYFFGMISSRDMRLQFPWIRSIENLPKTGLVEWIVHPGFPDETLKGRDDYLSERAAELKALTQSPGPADAWQPINSCRTRKSIFLAQPSDGTSI